MTRKFGFTQTALSAGVFAGILFLLVSTDARVRDHVSDLVGSGSVGPLGERAGDLGAVLWSALRHQSIDNAPLLVFATVGTVLTIFMLRS
jgi:hypothetical protein